MDSKNFLNFRCEHRHSAITHPKCYLRFINGGKIPVVLPKVLVFDIETSPLKAFVFQKSVWKTNVTDDQVISEWFMLCWSAKWLFDGEIMSDRLTGKEAIKEDDKRIVKSLWELLDEADIVIAHNGDSFDIPNMNTRFVVQNFFPPSPYQTVDTKSVAKKQFGFTHNSLDALCKQFGLGEKKQTDFELWKNCVDGDDEALQYMQEYNIDDVKLLEELYLKLRPWIKGHPNLGLYIDIDEPVCPNCGSRELQYIGKYHYTSVNKFPLVRCECGAFGRIRKSEMSPEVKKNLLAPMSR